MLPAYIVLTGPHLGIDGCYKCPSCMRAKLYEIQRQYEPDPRLASDDDDAWA